VSVLPACLFVPSCVWNNERNTTAQRPSDQTSPEQQIVKVEEAKGREAKGREGKGREGNKGS